MALTGGLLIAILVIIALLLFALVLLDLPRSRPRWAQRTLRGAEVVALNVVVVVLCGALLNDQYYFYESWSDLLGGQSQATSSASYGATAKPSTTGALGNRFTHWSAPARLPALPYPGSRLQVYSVAGTHPGYAHRVLVYLPAHYDPAAARTYPVLVALPGLPSSPESWTRMLHIGPTVDAAVAAHKIGSPIVVVPQTNEPARLDTECVDSPDPAAPQIDTWLSSTLPHWIVDHFRATRARSAWAITGYSYGGWCAAAQLFRHPDVYSAGMVFEGYFTPEFASSYQPFMRTSPMFARYDLAKVAAARRPRVALWVLAAGGDPTSYSSTQRLLAAIHAPTSATAVVLRHGGHLISVFEPYIPQAIEWLGSSVPGFSATAHT